MKVRKSTFKECLPFLKEIWPDSYHIFPFDNPVGLVKWVGKDIVNTCPTFYVLENDFEVVATLHLFYADSTTLCLRGLYSKTDIGYDEWRRFLNVALEEMKTPRTNNIYTVFKQPINSLVEELGFSSIQGPFWTEDWKLYVARKSINDELYRVNNS